MTKTVRLFILAALVALGLGAGSAFALAATTRHAAKPSDKPPEKPVGLPGVFYDDSYVMGSPKAKVVLTEYASPVCSHCARFDAEVFPKIKAKYIDTGLIRYELREMLTAPDDLAAAAWIVARCTGKDHYFVVLEGFFRAQADMASGRPGTEPATILMRLAKDNGADQPRFQACLSDPEAVSRLNARIDRAFNVDKIDSTPSIFVNGARVTAKNEWTIEQIDAALQGPLKAAGTKGR